MGEQRICATTYLRSILFDKLAKVIKLVCQGCNAALEVDEGQRQVNCTYCGTPNHIQRQPAAAPAPPRAPHPPPPPAHVPGPPAHVVRHTPVVVNRPRRGRFLGFLIPLMLSIGITAAVVVQTGQIDLGDYNLDGLEDLMDSKALSGTGNTGFHVHSARPLIADADGDGTEDVVLVTRTKGSTQNLQLTAFSGADWKELWETESFGDLSSLAGNLAVYYHDETVLVMAGTSVRAFDLATGTLRWTTNLTDKVDRVSAGGEGKVIVETIDEVMNLVDLASGDLGTAATHGHALFADQGFALIPSDAEMDLKYDQFEGLRVDQAFCPRDLRTGPETCDHPRGVAIAERNKGTRIPYVVGYDRESKEMLWKVQVTPDGSVETASGGVGPRIEVLGERGLLTYQIGSDPPRMRMMGLGDGKAYWDVAMEFSGPTARSGRVDGAVQTEKRIYVKALTDLYVFDAKDGKRIGQLGSFF